MSNEQKGEEITGFTPGPWELSNEYSSLPYLQSILSVGKVGEGDIVCTSPQKQMVSSMKNWAANARLIASAPTMYTELQQLKEENKRLRELVERATKANIGRPSQLIEQFEQFQKECIEALSLTNKQE